jgi:hypothetical protein
MAIDISRPETSQPDEQSDRLFFEGLLAALGNRREIRAIAAASYVPPTPPLGNYRFAIEGRTTSSEDQSAFMSAVSPSAFRLLGIPLLRGRLIDEGDSETRPHVAVISDTLARRYWRDEDPIGHRIVPVGSVAPVTIVGVVGNVPQPLSKDPRAEAVIYVSYRQSPWPFMTVIFAPALTAADAVAAVRQEIVRLNPTQAAGSVRVLDALRAEWLVQPQLQTTVVTVFGLATLFLTVIGLYARIAHAVMMRAREFAIRQAVGATPRDVVGLLTRDAFVVVAAGLLLGIVAMPFSTRALRSLVIDTASPDVGVVAAVSVLLAVTAMASAYWPARRAGRNDPVVLLKAEQ